MIALDLLLRFTSGRATRSVWEWFVTVFLSSSLVFIGTLLIVVIARRSKR